MQRPDDLDDQPLTMRDIPELQRMIQEERDPNNPDRASPSIRERYIEIIQGHIVWMTEQALAGTTLEEDGGKLATATPAEHKQ